MAGENIAFIDFHVHLRGGMTAEKAVARQRDTGHRVGVLRNAGRNWPIDGDDALADFLDSVDGLPLLVGLQVNDRDWYTALNGRLLDRLDFVLADTMIMPMPEDTSTPVKLWMPELYTIDDPEAWMQRYLAHNLRVLAEPISILANPTYLPPAVQDLYDDLWTDDRMQQIIDAAVTNHVALEVPARSQFPGDRFITMAKGLGAQFSFGSNNFDDIPIDMSRCMDAIRRFGLTEEHLFLPDA
jgi:hypothetical protein